MCGDGAGISVRPINGNIRILYTVSVVNDTSTWWSRAWHSRVAGTRAPQRRQTWFSSWISSRTRTHTCPIPWPSDPAENSRNCSIKLRLAVHCMRNLRLPPNQHAFPRVWWWWYRVQVDSKPPCQPCWQRAHAAAAVMPPRCQPHACALVSLCPRDPHGPSAK